MASLFSPVGLITFEMPAKFVFHWISHWRFSCHSVIEELYLFPMGYVHLHFTFLIDNIFSSLPSGIRPGHLHSPTPTICHLNHLSLVYAYHLYGDVTVMLNLIILVEAMHLFLFLLLNVSSMCFYKKKKKNCLSKFLGLRAIELVYG